MKLFYDKKAKDPTYYAQQGIRNGKKTTTRNVRNFGKHSELLKITDDPLACIATMISKLMNLEMIYIDHLGPHNRITGINFLENYQAYQNYLLVVDFVCQGNEILRAQNIVEFIGGKYIGFVGMIKLEISKISKSQTNEEIIKETVVKISPEEAVEKLEYTIKTKLCCKSKK